jgi:hypothetical protein
MAQMERASAKRRKRAHVQHIILQSVATAGVLSVALVAPNVLGAMDKLGLVPHSRQKDSIQRARDTLIKKGLLQYAQGKVRLTDRGEKALAYAAATNLNHVQRKWDGRWRVVIFDIPEYRKSTRQKVRMMLRSFGFQCLQNSVWIYPYDCEDAILLLKADAKVGKGMLYMIVDTLEGDKQLRSHFGLKS